MEPFYRAMRRHFSVLMDGDEPAGGQWNFDRENRKPLPRGLTPPADTAFEPDAITLTALVEIGLAPERWAGYATTREEALRVLSGFLSERLPSFGAYEDAMSGRSHSLYHSVLSPYLNLGLLEPLEVVRAAEAAYRDGRAPLNSAEGFIRQVLGWREYMAWQYWRQMPGYSEKNAWDAHRPLPGFFWTGETDMACLRHAIGRALETGYNHHIERLMLLSNYLMLAGVDPAEANDWFLSVYVDAYEWVMPPNVIGMGLNADDGLTATKPYIASAAYINRMGDHCAACVFDPRARAGPSACPFNALYWNFLIEHEGRLRANPRLGPAVLGLRHLDEHDRAAVRAAAAAHLDSTT
jgi:deoxyribodipyrimidine photolyase-related protein